MTMPATAVAMASSDQARLVGGPARPYADHLSAPRESIAPRTAARAGKFLGATAPPEAGTFSNDSGTVQIP